MLEEHNRSARTESCSQVFNHKRVPLIQRYRVYFGQCGRMKEQILRVMHDMKKQYLFKHQLMYHNCICFA